MIAAIAVWIVLIAAAPWTISDHNEFLKNFVNHEFLSFMGVIVAITIASGSNLYMELTKIELRLKRPLPQAKSAIRNSVYGLLFSLFAAVPIVVVKPLAGPDEHMRAFFNGLALLTMLFSAIILIDIVQAAFRLNPVGLDESDDGDGNESNEEQTG